jgi:[glutamine synthetase] adenylyltransferase / [glutamine synthetase]-adenylyl-L-tyrosine phosphorylase
MTATLAESLVDAPRLSAPAEARRRLAAFVNTSSAELAREIERGRTRDVLLGVADHSPYLWTLVQEDPARLVRLPRFVAPSEKPRFSLRLPTLAAFGTLSQQLKR